MALKTIKNRVDALYQGMYDGVVYELTGGQEMTVMDFVARHLKNQSIYSDNPITGERKYRLAILEDGDDDSPLSQDLLPLDSLDRTDTDAPKVEYRRSGIKVAVPDHQKGSGRFDSISMTAKN